MNPHWIFKLLLLAACVSLVSACGTFEIGIERTPAPPEPGRSLLATTAAAAIAPTPIPVTPTTTSPDLPALQAGDLPHALYFLGRQCIWRLKPGDMAVEQITPDDRAITSFDVWPQDGRIAYGTGGELFVMLPDQAPRLLHDVSAKAPYPVEISSVSWSPDGTRLAYTVGYTSEQAKRNAGYPSYPSGLWLVDMKDTTPTWLLSNHYQGAGKVDPNAMLVIEDPIWSPDGTALMLTGWYWEWVNTLWLDPIAPDLNETNLHEASGGLWTMSSWSSNSRSLLLSGYENATYGDLVQVDRASLKSNRLIKGEAEGLLIDDAQELPSGIVFLGFKDEESHQIARLYLGHQNEKGFEYSLVGPEHLCASHVEWDSTSRWGVEVCEGDSGGQHAVHIITLDGKDIDITPYLSQLENTESLKALWGK